MSSTKAGKQLAWALFKLEPSTPMVWQTSRTTASAPLPIAAGERAPFLLSSRHQKEILMSAQGMHPPGHAIVHLRSDGGTSHPAGTSFAKALFEPGRALLERSRIGFWLPLGLALGACGLALAEQPASALALIPGVLYLGCAWQLRERHQRQLQTFWDTELAQLLRSSQDADPATLLVAASLQLRNNERLRSEVQRSAVRQPCPGADGSASPRPGRGTEPTHRDDRRRQRTDRSDPAQHRCLGQGRAGSLRQRSHPERNRLPGSALSG
ncbi:hypothetical protein EMIT0194MI4_20687 [Pseudomonas sp. IT-194MI4]